MNFKNKFIGFVDILGFKKLVDATEKGTGMPLPELLELIKVLGSPQDKLKFAKYGPLTCPESKYLNRDLDFQLTQISDCVIVSSEVSPAGVINLVHHCWGIIIELLTKGIMCRGYITQGTIYHTDTQVIGSGYQKAYDKESHVSAFRHEADERGTPFVEIDAIVCNYVKENGDKCVIDMFSRMVKEDGEVTALFPFKKLSHSFIIAGPGYTFDPVKEKIANQDMRQGLETLKSRIESYVDILNPSAVKKARHYINALNAQIKVCDKIDNMIG